MQSLLWVQAALLLLLSFINKYSPYPGLIHGHQRKHFCNRLAVEMRHERDFGISTGCFPLLYPGANFFSCGTPRKTPIKLEIAKKANTDFHSLNCSIAHRVIQVLLEENTPSLTDGMVETVLRMKSMNSYWTLIFSFISATSRKQWLPIHFDIFLYFQALRQHWDPAGFGNSSCSSYHT